MDRVKDMYYRDRNHTCVLIWSLGNESFCGENFVKMQDFLKKEDPSRLVHYEGNVYCVGCFAFAWIGTITRETDRLILPMRYVLVTELESVMYD